MVSSISPFPLLYHAHLSLYPQDLPFWIKLAEKYGDPILELGCGTGRVLLPLARSGHQVYGIDNDLEMISFLKSQLTESVIPSPYLILEDMVSLKNENLSGLSFSLVISPCNTLSALKDADLQTVMSNAYHFLRPGGCFAASIPNPQVLSNLPKKAAPEVEEIIEHPISGNKVQISSSWKRSPESFVVRWDYDHLLETGQIDRVSVISSHVIRSTHFYLEQLTLAGYKSYETYGDIDETPYEIESPLLVWVAIK